MLFATYDDDMGGDQYDRLPGALQSWGETSVWSVTLCGKKVVSRSYTLLELGLTYLRLCSVEGESVRGLQEGCHCCWWKSITRGLNEQPFVGRRKFVQIKQVQL